MPTTKFKGWEEYEALDRCGCGHPNARPPCSYCEGSSVWDDDEEDLIYNEGIYEYRKPLYGKPKPTLDPLQMLQNKYDALVIAYGELEDAKGKELYELISLDVQDNYKSQIMEDVRDEAYTDIYQHIARTEQAKMREKIEAQLRATVIEEIRQEILAEMRRVSDLV